MSPHSEPADEQLQPFRLTHSQYRILLLVGAGAHSTENTPDWIALEQRGFISRPYLNPWQITAQGEAILQAITELGRP